jgi:hypothetical protein
MLSCSLQIDFLDDNEEVRGAQQVTVLGALSTVFQIKKEVSESNGTAGMCERCAELLSHLYAYYVQLLDFSAPTAPICTVLRQFKTHFEGKSGKFTTYDGGNGSDASMDLDDSSFKTGVRNTKRKNSRSRNSTTNSRSKGNEKGPGKRSNKKGARAKSRTTPVKVGPETGTPKSRKRGGKTGK